MHIGHKLIEITDEEELKKNNITIESSTLKFNIMSQKITNLKENIENEIEKINNEYDKVYKEVGTSFEKKHEKLIKEENDLKENLQNEVTKVKEKLEKYLSEVNNIVKTCEKINKGIKILNDGNKNISKILSYVSKINKNKKEMMSLFKELMRNLKISFSEEETNINYNEYFFNGLPAPKNIEFKEIGTNNCKLFWEIDNINLNLDKQKIKFKVELRKENNKVKFLKIYEGSELNCLIDNLEKNTIYEIKICSIFDDLLNHGVK